MSFKYRFILSFVLLEAFFIILIVSINFYSIKNSSDNLINEKIESNITFLEELIKVPISIFDLAALDNLVNNSTKYMNSIVILDNQNRLLSSDYSYKYLTLEEFIKIKSNMDVNKKNESYKFRFKEIYEDNILLGSMYIIFDITSNQNFIDNNKQNTIFIVLLEILISTILAYLIGNSLTKKLVRLSQTAIRIGDEENTKIPYDNDKSEIGKLADSLKQMQKKLIQRRDTINKSNKLLEKQRDDLSSANQTKDDFLANMSHELKTPLNSINVISSIMKKNKNLNNTQIKNLEIINNAGKDLLSLINDVLDISKLDAGEMQVNYKKIDLTQSISKMEDMFTSQYKNKNLSLIIELDKNSNIIYSDEGKLHQIIKNLLSNALKFTNEGEVKLKIIDQGNNVSIIVKDQGIGIPKSDLSHIFDRFKQVDTSTSRKFLGTGLGLAITKNLTQLLKGTVIVESEVNIGTKFTITIPKNSEKIINKEKKDIKKEINEEVIVSKKEIVDDKKNTLNKKLEKILVYNTNPVVLFSLVIALQKIYDVIQVNSKEKLFDEMKKQDIDYILINMDTINHLNYKVLFDNYLDKLIITSKNKLPNELQNKYTSMISLPIDIEKIKDFIKEKK